MPPIHSTKHTLQHPLRIQSRPRAAHPRHRIHHIANNLPLPPHLPTVLPNIIIQLLQHHLRLRVLADLKELDTDLPRGRIPPLELARRGDDHGLDVVGGLPVGDDDDVEGLDVLFTLGLEFTEIRAQDRVQAAAGGGSLLGADAVEDGFDGGGGGDVAVLGPVGRVQEVDVDAVGVVGGADGRDGLEGVAGFAPAAAGHAAGIVDQEDGVEGGEEGEVRVFGGGGARGGGG